MEPYVAVYLEVNGICFIVLLLIANKYRLSRTVSAADSAFLKLILGAAFIMISDSIWFLGDNRIIDIPRMFTNIVCALYMSLTGVICWYWYLFAEIKFKCRKLNSGYGKYIMMIPMLLLIMLSIISMKTGWIFYITEDGLYKRGSFHLMQVMICFFYLIFAAVHGIIKGMKTKNRFSRGEYITIASFIVLPIVGSVLQVMYFGIPYMMAGIILSILMIFLSLQENQINVDSQTGLNNRKSSDVYVESLVSGNNENVRIYMLLMDINSFKGINDKYGHVEGDHALVIMANVLKEIAGETNSFAARIGGDEFHLICRAADDDQVNALASCLQERLMIRTKEYDLPYMLTISIGWARYESPESAIQWKVRADKELYANKRLYHKLKNK